MPTLIEDGVEYCIELSPNEDDGDNTNKPSIDKTETKDISHCR